jgi:hypothetical protein
MMTPGRETQARVAKFQIRENIFEILFFANARRDADEHFSTHTLRRMFITGRQKRYGSLSHPE